MKRTLFLLICAALSLGSATEGMESCKTNLSNLTFVDELHICIVLYVVKKAPIDEALANLKNYSITCKRISVVLKDKKITHTLIDYMIKHTRGFTSASLCQLLSVLDTDQVIIYRNNMMAGKKIHNIFKKCNKKRDWDEAVTRLNSLKTEPLSYQMVNFRWTEESTKYYKSIEIGQSTFIEDEDLLIQKNLLTEALSLDAPFCVIDLLIVLKADTNLIDSGPSALCIAVKKFLACKEEGIKKDLQVKIDCLMKADADKDYVYFTIIEGEKTFRHITNITPGNPFNRFKKEIICPLTLAAQAYTIEKVLVLIELGVIT